MNYHTPDEICSVKYNDLDHTVTNSLFARQQLKAKYQEKECKGQIKFDELSSQQIESGQSHDGTIFLGKTDVQSAFCLVPLSLWSWPWLIMMARSPFTKKWCFFVDKCLPFGASISCAIFQHFSNALKHITQVRSGQKTISNYLDDFCSFRI